MLDSDSDEKPVAKPQAKPKKGLLDSSSSEEAPKKVAVPAKQAAKPTAKKVISSDSEEVKPKPVAKPPVVAKK